MDSSEGRRQFRIGRCLGRGGFGEVYRASMRSPGGLETPVALKILRGDLDLQDEAMRRLRDEGRMLARVTHPAVVRAHDLTRIDGRVALVTEYVEGEDLDRFLAGPDRIGPKALLEVVAALALALDAAWSTSGLDGEPLRIVHRDVKPTNVRLGRHGQVKLLDFGIARFSGADRESHTASDVVMGSLPYMAPERFVERAALPASDVFGLGCILYEGLAGAPFHLEGRLRVLSPMALDPQRYDAHLRSRLGRIEGPAEWVAVVEDCLRFDPDARPTAALLATRLEALAEAIEGPSLRRWCADRSWSDAPPIQGELEGKTLAEGALAIGPGSVEVEAAPRRPSLTARPIGTMEGAFEDGGAVAAVADLAREGVVASAAPAPESSGGGGRLPVAVLVGLGCAGVAVLFGVSLGFALVAVAVSLAI